MSQQSLPTKKQAPSIWWFALGYFACYVPYSATTKALTRGLLDNGAALPGLSILPLGTFASLLTGVAFLTAMGWWRHATQFVWRGRSLPRPTWLTAVSGLCISLIAVTTTLAYTFEGVTIVFAMLLMRGGVLILAPLVDALTGRRARWTSWVALLLSLGALLAAFLEDSQYNMTLLCAVDIAIYLLSYFVRLQLMNRLAKSDDPEDSLRYFVEEQIIGMPALLLLLLALALVGPSSLAPLRAGFFDIFSTGAWPYVVFIGVLAQGTGIFGGLVLLDKRETTFCVPVNRSSSILAGVCATLLLHLGFGLAAPSPGQLVGAALIVSAIGVLMLPAMRQRVAREK